MPTVLASSSVGSALQPMQCVRMAAGVLKVPRLLVPMPAVALCPRNAAPAALDRSTGRINRRTSATRFRPAASSSSSEASPAAVPPARRDAFLTVVLPTALTLLLCNMDRICLSIAILPMSKELNWPASMQGIIQSAFLWGYMATQLLGGTLADKYGGKLVMAGGIVWFSLASMLLPLAVSEPMAAAGLTVPAVLFARCMVGLGEGVALPTMNNLVASFIPKESKARALGMAFSGFHSGNLLGLIISPILLLQFGWRWLFCIFGLLGAPLLALWLSVVPDTTPSRTAGSSPSLSASGGPATLGSSGASSFAEGSGQVAFRDNASGQSQASSSSSRSDSGGAEHSIASTSGRGGSTDAGGASPAQGQKVGVGKLMSHPATWAIIIVNIVNHWGYFIYLNWMPSYFSSALGFDLRASSLLSFLPWLVMAIGSSAAGLLADSLVSRGVPVVDVRKRLQTVAFLIPAAALMVLAQPGIKPELAVAAMTIALGTTSLGQAGFVANMSDIAPQQAGQMFGLCNTFGSLSGIVGVTAVGFIVEATQSFSPVFLMTAGMYVVGTLVWNMMCVGERVF